MKPFFSYMGSKWQLAKVYGPPKHALVIEPFAGSAAYSVRHEPEIDKLYDLSHFVTETWKYLISASAEDVACLPIDFDSTDDLEISQGAKFLIGWWLNRGTSVPHKTRSAWARQYRHSGDCKVWSEQARDRIVSQLPKIRQWEAKNLSWSRVKNVKATWLIDPPYQNVKGSTYSHNSIDYTALASFCRSRKGQTIVCEGEGANWLPFEKLKTMRGTFGEFRSGKSQEVVYVK